MAELSPLRRRMIEDMTVRNLSPATQRSYVHAVSKFSRCDRHRAGGQLPQPTRYHRAGVPQGMGAGVLQRV
jgi:hypothetical protein